MLIVDRSGTLPVSALFKRFGFAALLLWFVVSGIGSSHVYGFEPLPIKVPAGFTVEVAAAPPLVTHPTMGCFDEVGHFYVCNNAGVNLRNDELERQLPNAIYRLTDSDGDGKFDQQTVFADKMTFPMGGVWHEGSLYVASPPHIWRLTDTDGDGVADQREVIVEKFGYNGNAASIHGCFLGPDGRIYWTDGYHGHEFTDEQGNLVSSREGSYLFSCLPSGQDVQIHCGGGMDNPVEIDFTDAGELLGTVNILYTRPRVDCFVHWLYGGAYPHRDKVLDEIKTTGPRLGPVHRFGHVAVSGTTRYRSGVLEPRWQDNFFATFFNSGKVVRLELTKSGSTFEAIQHEFLSSDHAEFHPTDVIEDADGSLLVIDTGGWFYHGCPTSQFAKPEIRGAIYRIRREGMPVPSDPRGNELDLAKASGEALIKRLEDPRPVVRERVIQECVRRGRPMLAAVENALADNSSSTLLRNNLVWILARGVQRAEMAEDSVALLQRALDDREAMIRQVACRSLSHAMVSWNPQQVIGLLKDPDASVRRQAAETLGRLRDPATIAPLAAELDREMDRSEEHALIYALIEIDQPQPLQAELAGLVIDDPPSARRLRRAMLALDQMTDQGLQLAQILAGLRSSDRELQMATLDILGRRPEWNELAMAFFAESFEAPSRLLKNPEMTRTLVGRHAGEPVIAKAIGKTLASPAPVEVRRLLLQGLAKSLSPPLDPSWIPTLTEMFHEVSGEDQQLLIAAISAMDTTRFNQQLESIGSDPSADPLLRVSALAAVQNQGTLSDATFELLKNFAGDVSQPQASLRAIQLIAASRLETKRLQSLVPLLASASPLHLRELVACFGRSRDPDTIAQFYDALANAKSFLSLAPNEFSDAIKRYPAETLPRGNQLLRQLEANEAQKADRLAALSTQLGAGNAERGHQLFYSEKSKCSSCHRVGEQGHRVGPDLTNIGSNRSANDLLESIVFPSASIVRDYETYQVLTDDGRVITGLLASESGSALVIQQASGDQVTVQRDSIEDFSTSPVSVMPSSLDETLEGQDIADLVAYLLSQR